MPTIVQRVLIGLALIVLVFLFVKSVAVPSGSSSPTPAQPFADATMPVPTVVLTQIAGALLQPEVTPPADDAVWSQVVEVSGSESTRTQPFQLSGSTVKLHYNLALFEGNATALLFVFFVPEEQAPNQGGLPDVFAVAAGQGEKYLSRPPGSYILNVQAIGGSWTIDVDEVAS